MGYETYRYAALCLESSHDPAFKWTSTDSTIPEFCPNCKSRNIIAHAFKEGDNQGKQKAYSLLNYLLSKNVRSETRGKELTS